MTCEAVYSFIRRTDAAWHIINIEACQVQEYSGVNGADRLSGEGRNPQKSVVLKGTGQPPDKYEHVNVRFTASPIDG